MTTRRQQQHNKQTRIGTENAASSRSPSLTITEITRRGRPAPPKQSKPAFARFGGSDWKRAKARVAGQGQASCFLRTMLPPSMAMMSDVALQHGVQYVHAICAVQRLQSLCLHVCTNGEREGGVLRACDGGMVLKIGEGRCQEKAAAEFLRLGWNFTIELYEATYQRKEMSC